ncbi:MAG: glyoxalase/bleomycin resistance protein/dioxygenase [Polaromonas sp.]|nr:glyoxalase/bleomycin resistance protein/dioxygenase [Polaromonas sp.]
MPAIFVLNVPEFLPLVEHARKQPECKVVGPRLGYWRISGSPVLAFKRKELGFKPAVWHGSLTGGFVGHITHFDNDSLTIAEASA